MEVAPHLKDSLNRNFFDLLGAFRQISSESVQNQLVLQRVEVPEYLTLYSPAINWILQCIAYRAPEARRHTPSYLNLFSFIFTNPKISNNSVFSGKSVFLMLFVFPRQPLLTEMMERCKKLGNK